MTTDTVSNQGSWIVQKNLFIELVGARTIRNLPNRSSQKWKNTVSFGIQIILKTVYQFTNNGYIVCNKFETMIDEVVSDWNVEILWAVNFIYYSYQDKITKRKNSCGPIGHQRIELEDNSKKKQFYMDDRVFSLNNWENNFLPS